MSKAKEALFTQVKLVRPIGDSRYAQLTTWVDADSRLKKGVVITLKKDNNRWMIEEVYGTQTISDIDARNWDNNDYSKHEGLGL
jgi:uncharacterized membrane-anchored protein